MQGGGEEEGEEIGRIDDRKVWSFAQTGSGHDATSAGSPARPVRRYHSVLVGSVWLCLVRPWHCVHFGPFFPVSSRTPLIVQGLRKGRKGSWFWVFTFC